MSVVVSLFCLSEPCVAYDKLNFQYWKVGVGGAELEIGDLDLLIKTIPTSRSPHP